MTSGMSTRSTKKATINEIRTQRLSRVLQAMDARASSVPRVSHPNGVASMFLATDHPADGDCAKVDRAKDALARTQSSSTIDELESGFRVRTSSITRNQFRSLRVQALRGSAMERTRDTNGNDRNSELSPPAIACEAVNRFVRHLAPRYESVQTDHNIQTSKSGANHRTRTATVCGRVPRKDPTSPLPTLRIRAETESSPKTESKARLVSQSHTSKSCSTSSSRSLSPMPFMGFAGGMLGSIASDQQLSPGSPLSPSWLDGKFTILVVGSKGVGKTSLINRFLQMDIRKGSPHYDSGTLGDDNSVSLMVDDEEANLRFIEINNQKSDLWLSLSGAAYVALYNFDDASSFRNATEVVSRLRKRNDTSEKPIMLVSNKQNVDRRRFIIANDDGRHVAKQNHCKFHEVYIGAGRSTEDLLISIIHEVRCHYTHRSSDVLRTKESLTEDLNLSPLFCDHGHSMVSSLGMGLFHIRTSSASSTSSTASKASSLSSFGQKLWSRRKVKQCKSVEAAEDLILREYGQVALAKGLQDCLFGERRGSRSLEALPLATNDK